MKKRGRQHAATRSRPKRTRGKPSRKPRRHVALWLSAAAALLFAIGLAAFLAEPPQKPAPREAVAVIPPQAPPEKPTEEASLPPPSPPVARPAWERFAVPAPEAGDRPRIAIVIDDCGLDRPRTERAIALPANVTLSFLPYSNDLDTQTGEARRNGHELLVHVPMQPVDARMDMGPNGLAVGQPRDEVLRRLRWDLDRFGGYVGINNHMGSRFTADAQAMDWVLGELKERGLMFLNSRTIASTTGEVVASREDVPYAARDVFLDDDQQANAVMARLKDVEAVARKRGTAIAIGHPHDATLAALAGWIASLPRDGIVLVPLTDIVKARAQVE